MGSLLEESSESLACQKKQFCTSLAAIDVTDCRFHTADAAALLQHFPTLKFVHLQSMGLSGLAAPTCPHLESLSITDCKLGRADAIDIAAQCPALRMLNLCGNDLGEKESNLDCVRS